MIPSDVGIQVRSQTDASLHSVRPVAEIPADLPDLQPGQVFRAKIQEILPDNTYKALVAGRSFTLALPEGAKAGDTLELVVVDRTPRAIIARQAVGGGLVEGGAEPYLHATLSRTGQLIASLLTRDGGVATSPTLTSSRPLFASPLGDAAMLAQQLPARLAQAVTASGLFYESHQVQWALGQRPLASLLVEPQGQHSNPVALTGQLDGASAAANAEKSALAIRREGAENTVSALSLLRTLFGGASASADTAQAGSTVPPTLVAPAAQTMPDDLRPLVQQQLDMGASQRLAWHGEVWPRQAMEWEISRDAPQADVAVNEPDVWRTHVRLVLPRLGALDAQLQLRGPNVQLTLQAQDAVSVADLRVAATLLQSSLMAAGLALQNIQIRHAD
jgi:hypothetical protein